MDKVTREIKRLPGDYRTPSGFKIAEGYALWVDGKLEQVGSRESLVNIVKLTEKREKIMKIRKMGFIAWELIVIVAKVAGVVLAGFVLLELAMYVVGGMLANSYGR